MIYLDNSATSYPKPRSVRRAVYKAQREYFTNPGRSTSKNSAKTALALFEAREALAKLLGTSPENVVFTYNATYALNMALFGIIKPHMKVAVDAFAHNSVMRPLYRLMDMGAEVTVLETDIKRDSVIISSLEKAILLDKPDVVVITHTSNVTGKTLPLERIGALCRKNKIKLIVDASQSIGSQKIDMRKMGIDLLASSGHKGLYGMTGSGFLAVGDLPHSEITPLVLGGSGIFSLERDMPPFLPERFEAGTLGMSGIMSMKAGAEFILKTGEEEIWRKEKELQSMLASGLSSMRGVVVYNAEVNSNSVVLFNLDGLSSEYVGSELAKRGVTVRAGYHCAPTAHEMLGTVGGVHNGAVRLSVGFFNTKKECERVLAEIYRITKNTR